MAAIREPSNAVTTDVLILWTGGLVGLLLLVLSLLFAGVTLAHSRRGSNHRAQLLGRSALLLDAGAALALFTYAPLSYELLTSLTQQQTCLQRLLPMAPLGVAPSPSGAPR